MVLHRRRLFPEHLPAFHVPGPRSPRAWRAGGRRPPAEAAAQAVRGAGRGACGSEGSSSAMTAGRTTATPVRTSAPKPCPTARNPERLYNLRYTWRMSDRNASRGAVRALPGPRYPVRLRRKARTALRRTSTRPPGSTRSTCSSSARPRARVQAAQFALTKYIEGFAAKSHDVKVGLEHERAQARAELSDTPATCCSSIAMASPNWSGSGPVRRAVRPSIGPACSCRTRGG